MSFAAPAASGSTRRFKLVAQNDPDLDLPAADETAATIRRATTTNRIVRSIAVAQRVKKIPGHECQVCGLRINTPAGPYAEAAHIRALGTPHHGPDEESNLLCLCPNHHVMFDAGAIYINDIWIVCDGATRNQMSALRRRPRHVIDRRHVKYHREHHVP